MKRYDETGTAERREYERGITGVVANAMGRDPFTPEDIVYRTGLSADAVRLALNLLNTKDRAIVQKGLWVNNQK